MGAPKPAARLSVAEQEARSARNFLEEVAEEIGSSDPDQETVFFLLDQTQSSVSRARSQVAAYFAAKEANDG